MDPHFLATYNSELLYLREAAAEFAQQHPKIARRLGMQGMEIADPYVERLIESFCFMSARMQLKLDAEFPRFTQRLLEVIYPNYVSPTPSMAVAQLHPDMCEGDLRRGFRIAPQTAFFAKVPHGETTACEFRSSQEVTLWPLRIVAAELTGAPPDVAVDRHLPPHVKVQGALRLTLQLEGDASFVDISGLDRLPVYLAGEETVASHLFELLHTSALASVIGAPGKLAQPVHVVSQDALVQEGLQPQQSLLPLRWNSFHGHNLLREYFCCARRFYFFTLTGLAEGLRRIDGDRVEIVVLLSQAPGQLANHVDAARFALFCTPVINLFPGRTDRIGLNQSDSEFHLVPDRSKPLDYEVFSVEQLHGQADDLTEAQLFRPLFDTLHQDEGNYGRYFSLRREPRLYSETMRKLGTRTPYIGTEVFLSLVDQEHAPYRHDLRYLSAQAWLTNRDLPQLVPRNGVDDLRIAASAPVATIGLVCAPSMPQVPLAQREVAWQLIRQLSFNYLPLTSLNGREGGQALRELLSLFVTADDAVAMQQVRSLTGSDIAPVTRRLPGSGPLVYGRGVACRLMVDENGFSGSSPYLFGLILEHWLARHVSINVFTQTELHSMQRGLVARWPVRMGGRGCV
jgi:type VI secretion system protein ImpG